MVVHVTNRKVGEAVRIDGPCTIKLGHRRGRGAKLIIITESGVDVVPMLEVPKELLPHENSDGNDLALANDGIPVV